MLKNELITTPTLALFDPSNDTKITADASSFGLGGVISQMFSDAWKPIAYASRALTPTEQRYAQIEKETLAFVRACERFSCYLIGKHFLLKTDHKQLLSLLSTKHLDDLPPRLQRFRMRFMRYSYEINHVPGKQYVTPDTLSRMNNATDAESALMEDTNIYLAQIRESFPASKSQLDEIRYELKKVSLCSQIMRFHEHGWPRIVQANDKLRPYWLERDMISILDRLLLHGTRLIIPVSLQRPILKNIHQAHQELEKCRQRARKSVWWPGLSSQLRTVVQQCDECRKVSTMAVEPLQPTDFPSYPWQRAATDLFELKGQKCILTVDYYSRAIDVVKLSSTTSVAIMEHLKAVFSRNGVPEILISFRTSIGSDVQPWESKTSRNGLVRLIRR